MCGRHHQPFCLQTVQCCTSSIKSLNSFSHVLMRAEKNEEEEREREKKRNGERKNLPVLETATHLWPKMESVYLPCWRSKCLVGYFERLGWLVHANVTKPRAAALSGCC